MRVWFEMHQVRALRVDSLNSFLLLHHLVLLTSATAPRNCVRVNWRTSGSEWRTLDRKMDSSSVRPGDGDAAIRETFVRTSDSAASDSSISSCIKSANAVRSN